MPEVEQGIASRKGRETPPYFHLPPGQIRGQRDSVEQEERNALDHF